MQFTIRDDVYSSTRKQVVACRKYFFSLAIHPFPNLFYLLQFGLSKLSQIFLCTVTYRYTSTKPAKGQGFEISESQTILLLAEVFFYCICWDDG